MNASNLILLRFPSSSCSQVSGLAVLRLAPMLLDELQLLDRVRVARLEIVCVVFGDVGYARPTFSQVPFEQEIIYRGRGVVSVVQNVPPGYRFLRFLDCIELSDHGGIDRDGIPSYVYSNVFTNVDLLVPRVGPYPFDVQSVCRLGAKNLPDQVLA